MSKSQERHDREDADRFDDLAAAARELDLVVDSEDSDEEKLPALDEDGVEKQ